MEKMPEQMLQPFQLSSKAGFTDQLITEIRVHIQAGTSFTQIEEHLKSLAQARRDQILMKYSRHADFWKNVLKQQCSTEDIAAKLTLQSRMWNWPSDDAITRLFLQDFAAHMHLYDQTMAQLTGRWISMDHTFKVAANIGVIRPCTGKWETQYSSVFIVLNEEGQVVGWQLTKGESLNEVDKLLTNLLVRWKEKTAEPPEMVIVDNCCKSRKHVQNIMGQKVKVFLDLFHAIQRVTMKISKRHPFGAIAASDFAKCFRSNGDLGATRTCETPDPATIDRNIKKFLLKYATLKDSSGANVLSQAAVHQVELLLKHVQKGCLSHIPPKATTSHNENLHKHMRHAGLNVPRISPFLALARLYVFFLRWNSNISQKQIGRKKRSREHETASQLTLVAQQCVTQMLNQSTSFQSSTNECFGMGMHHTCLGDASRYWQRMSEEQLRKIFNDQMEEKETATQNVGTHKDKDAELEYIAERAAVYFETLWHSRARNININPSTIQLTKNANLYCLLQATGDTDDTDSNMLATNLKERKMQLMQSTTGRTSFYQATTQALTGIATSKQPIWYHNAKTSNTVDLPQQLRVAVVKEWLQHTNYYQSMVTCDLRRNAEKHLQEEPMESPLDTLIPLAAANVLSMHIMVVTSAESLPVIPCFARQAHASEPVYLAYNRGEGNYHAITCVETENESVVKPATKKRKNPGPAARCTCGKGATGQARHTVPRCNAVAANGRHQCPCYAIGEGCGYECMCINCTNEHGSRSKQPTSKRSKTNLSLTHTTGVESMLTYGENPTVKKWTHMELCMLETAITWLENREGKNEVTAGNVANVYNKITNGDMAKAKNLPLVERSREQIANQMKKRACSEIKVLNLVRYQLELDMDKLKRT